MVDCLIAKVDARIRKSNSLSLLVHSVSWHRGEAVEFVSALQKHSWSSKVSFACLLSESPWWFPSLPHTFVRHKSSQISRGLERTVYNARKIDKFLRKLLLRDKAHSRVILPCPLFEFGRSRVFNDRRERPYYHIYTTNNSESSIYEMIVCWRTIMEATALLCETIMCVLLYSC
jgi:hypothetical protein